MYSICFVNKVLMRRAMEESPWLIMGHCMVLKEWGQGVVVKEVHFSKILFWVQIHNVLLDLLTKANAEVIGRKLRRVVLVEDPSGESSFGRGVLKMRLGIGIEKL